MKYIYLTEDQMQGLGEFFTRVIQETRNDGSLPKDAEYFRAIIFNEDWIREAHPTEQKYPEQTKRFREILDEMYQTHLEKNADYSKYNIIATGIVGIATRFWDKTARVMNLIGFDIGTGEYTGIKENTVEDEPIHKTFLDAANYGIIARIYLEGKWGK